MIDAFDKDVATKMPRTTPRERPKRPWDIHLQDGAPDSPDQTIAQQTIVTTTIDRPPIVPLTMAASAIVQDTIVPETILEEQVTKTDNIPGTAPDITLNSVYQLLPSLRPNEQAVLLRLYQLSRESERHTTDFVGYTRLAEQCNISLKTTYRTIKQLIDNKHIAVIAHDKHKGTKYQLNLQP